MDSESSSDEDFGQRLPPLSVAIKRILKSYPDGQIFKVGQLASKFFCTLISQFLTWNLVLQLDDITF